MKALLAAAFAATLLTGCGGSTGTDEGTLSKTNDVASGLTEDNSVNRTNSSDEALYLDIISSEYPNIVPTMGSQWTIDFAYNTCDAVGAGTDWATIMTWIDDPSLEDEIAYMVAAAITIFCPENEGLLF